MADRKVGEITVPTEPVSRATKITGFTFKSYDKNAGVLQFNIENQDGSPTDLIDATVRLFMYIYQGEEIGMTNPHFTRITDYRDVESHNMFAGLRAEGRDANELLAILASKSRDNSRTPMQWNNRKNAGFSQGEPWISL
ncbi:MAG: BppU family phage baseplate upper protein, partial [Sporomusaceae bacterium]|nr:BppU family phage baseplate upper protein [Sporomusaceae bacterium]